MKNTKAKIQGVLINSSKKSVIAWAVEEDDFEHVAEEIVKNCFIPNVINWVACKEELPVGDAENVLIVHNGNVKVGWYQKHTKLWWLSTTENSKDISYWAQIPKPPCL